MDRTERMRRAEAEVLGWFDGRAELRAAVAVVAKSHGPWVFLGWVREGSGPDLLPRVISAGYEVMPTGSDRDEVMPARERVRLLRAVAALEEANLDVERS